MRFIGVGWFVLAVCWKLGCRAAGDPAVSFIAEMETAPPEQRVPGWDAVKSRMERPAPRVGDTAPDFTLPMLEGDELLTRSTFQRERPMLLVFGSFT